MTQNSVDKLVSRFNLPLLTSKFLISEELQLRHDSTQGNTLKTYITETTTELCPKVGDGLIRRRFGGVRAGENDDVLFNKHLRRAQFLPFFAKLEPGLIGMESCSSAHHCAREWRALGHEVRLIPPMYVKP